MSSDELALLGIPPQAWSGCVHFGVKMSVDRPEGREDVSMRLTYSCQADGGQGILYVDLLKWWAAPPDDGSGPPEPLRSGDTVYFAQQEAGENPVREAPFTVDVLPRAVGGDRAEVKVDRYHDPRMHRAVLKWRDFRVILTGWRVPVDDDLLDSLTVVRPSEFPTGK